MNTLVNKAKLFIQNPKTQQIARDAAIIVGTIGAFVAVKVLADTIAIQIEARKEEPVIETVVETI